MLILTRAVGESVTVGHNILVRVLAIKGTQIRLGIEAPENLPVLREEIIAPVPNKPAEDH